MTENKWDHQRLTQGLLLVICCSIFRTRLETMSWSFVCDASLFFSFCFPFIVLPAIPQHLCVLGNNILEEWKSRWSPRNSWRLVAWRAEARTQGWSQGCSWRKVHLYCIVAKSSDLSAALPVTKRPFPVFKLTTNGYPTKGKQQRSKSKTALFPKKAFSFSFGGREEGCLRTGWRRERERHEARGNPSDPKPCPACFFFLSFYYFSLHLPHYFWLALWCRALFPAVALNISHIRSTAKLWSLWSHDSEPSSLTASKCLTCGDLPLWAGC